MTDKLEERAKKLKENLRKDRKKMGLDEFQIQLLEIIQEASMEIVSSLKAIRSEIEITNNMTRATNRRVRRK